MLDQGIRSDLIMDEGAHDRLLARCQRAHLSALDYICSILLGWRGWLSSFLVILINLTFDWSLGDCGLENEVPTGGFSFCDRAGSPQEYLRLSSSLALRVLNLTE